MRGPSAPQLLAAMYLATSLVQALGADQLERIHIGGSTGRTLRAREKKNSMDANEIQTLEHYHRTDQLNGDGSDTNKLENTKQSKTRFTECDSLKAATIRATGLGSCVSGAIARIFKRGAAGLVPGPRLDAVDEDKEDHSLVAHKLVKHIDKVDEKEESDPPRRSNLGVAITSVGGAVLSSLAFNTVSTIIKDGKEKKKPKSTNTSNSTTPANSPSATPSAGPATLDAKAPGINNLRTRSAQGSAIVQRGAMSGRELHFQS